MRRLTVLTVLTALSLILTSGIARAQDRTPVNVRRIAIDTVTGVQDFFREERNWPTQLVFDTFMTVQPRTGWQVSFRPKLWRVNGEWEMLIDHASVRYEFHRGSNWRIEAGRFPSPIGYGITENRPSLNPGLVWWHRPYYMPLPALAPGFPLTSLISTVYPTGVTAQTSGDHWDARAALVDRAPVQFWYGEERVPKGLHTVIGGGVTPRQGLRVGAGTAWGEAARASQGVDTPRYQMLTVEAEWAFAHTKMSGEWVHDRFTLATGDAIARGWTAQVQQTITPRMFAHTRTTFIQSPDGTIPSSPVLRRFRSIDTTLGYRLDPELTLRVSHAAIKSFTKATFDHQIGLSVMWTRRWW
jgi:hypothetical protein